MSLRQTDRIRLGGGSAFFNDRLDAALELVETGDIDVLMIETLAERTLALLHAAKRAGGSGYWDKLADRLQVLLPACAKHGTKFVTNGGGAAPEACAAMIARLARERGLTMKVAAVTGDDVTELVRASDPILLETGEPFSKLGTDIISTNAYLGADAIAAAYAAGADVIVTGRVTDSALALGPIMATLGWAADDLDAMACGVLTGHLLECGGQATGGYFAEPGLKDVPDLDRIGFPIAEVRGDRSITITKPPGSGGRIDRHTIVEQILYEMHDPAAYITPDVTLDVTDLDLAQDRHRSSEAQRRARACAARHAEGAGRRRQRRAGRDRDLLWRHQCRQARAARSRHHRQARGAQPDARQPDDPVRPDRREQRVAGRGERPVRDVRLRVAARVPDQRAANELITEVESLYVNGPAGGGGVRFATRPTIRTYTAFVPRADVTPRWTFVDA